MNRIFIDWQAGCSRSENIAHYFQAKPVFIFPFKSKGNKFMTIVRYVCSVFLTLIVLVKEKPKVVFVINLPFPLTITVCLFRKVFAYHYILDSHSGPFNDDRWKKLLPIYRKIAKKALLNINTCKVHKMLVEEWGGCSEIISDVPIYFLNSIPVKKLHPSSIAIVCSFNFDEPVREIWEAIRSTPEVSYYITGNYKLLSKELITSKPANLNLLGYIPFDEYYSMLKSVNAVMVLTYRSNTMQRGAYEALSLEKPIITSDFDILRESFGDAALYVNNSAEEIVQAVTRILEFNDTFIENARQQRKNRIAHFEAVKRIIEDKILTSA